MTSAIGILVGSVLTVFGCGAVFINIFDRRKK